MALLETPALLILGTDQEYIDRLRHEYNNKPITIAEGVEVSFFLLNDSDCMHSLAGKAKTKVNPFRAQRILWIKFILTNPSVRTVKRSLSNGLIVFHSNELGYVVVCQPTRKGLKYITQYICDKEMSNRLQDPTGYQTHTF